MYATYTSSQNPPVRPESPPVEMNWYCEVKGCDNIGCSSMCSRCDLPMCSACERECSGCDKSVCRRCVATCGGCIMEDIENRGEGGDKTPKIRGIFCVDCCQPCESCGIWTCEAHVHSPINCEMCGGEACHYSVVNCRACASVLCEACVHKSVGYRAGCYVCD